jgi:putative ABC transport system permease protein
VLPTTIDVAGFRGEFWRTATLPAEARQSFRGRSLMALARLKPGVGPAAAQQELSAIFQGLVAEHPDFNTGWTLNVVPVHEQLRSETRPALWTLFGAVVAVLLIACANVAALLLVRAAGRRHELAVKVSLGARPVHLARQFFVETAVLVGAGGLGGAALAAGLVRVVAATASDAGVPIATADVLDGTALLFAAAVTAVTVLVCGLGPALAARSTSAASALREGGRGQTGGGQRWRGWLVAGEVAAAMLILSGAALLGRSYVALQEVAPGFNPRQVLTARVSRMGPDAQAASVAFTSEVLARLRTAGVTAAAGTSFLPLGGNPGIASSFLLADRPGAAGGRTPLGRLPARDPRLLRGAADRCTPDATSATRTRRSAARGDRQRDIRAPVLAGCLAAGRRLTDSLGSEQEIVGVVGDVTPRVSALKRGRRFTCRTRSRRSAR